MHKSWILAVLMLSTAVSTPGAAEGVGRAEAELTPLLGSTGRDYIDLRNKLLATDYPLLAAGLRRSLTDADWQRRYLARAILWRAEQPELAEASLARLPVPTRAALAVVRPPPPAWKDLLPAFEGRAELAPLLVELLLKDSPDGPSVFLPLIDGVAVSGHWLRQCAASALGDTGDLEAVRPLLWAVSHDESERGWLRMAACFGLLKLGDDTSAALLRAQAQDAATEAVRRDLTATAEAVQLRLRLEALLTRAATARGAQYIELANELVEAGSDNRDLLLLAAIRTGPKATLLAQGALSRGVWPKTDAPVVQDLARVLTSGEGDKAAPDLDRWRAELTGRAVVRELASPLAETIIKDRGRRESYFVRGPDGQAVPAAWARACAALALGRSWPGDRLGGVSLRPLERHAWALFEEGAIEVLVEALVLEDEPYVHEAAQIGLMQMIERRALGGSAKKPVLLPRGEELVAKATAALDGAIAAAGTQSQRRRLQAALDAVRNIFARASDPGAVGSQGVSVPVAADGG